MAFGKRPHLQLAVCCSQQENIRHTYSGSTLHLTGAYHTHTKVDLEHWSLHEDCLKAQNLRQVPFVGGRWGLNSWAFWLAAVRLLLGKNRKWPGRNRMERWSISYLKTQNRTHCVVTVCLVYLSLCPECGLQAGWGSVSLPLHWSAPSPVCLLSCFECYSSCTFLSPGCT